MKEEESLTLIERFSYINATDVATLEPMIQTIEDSSYGCEFESYYGMDGLSLIECINELLLNYSNVCVVLFIIYIFDLFLGVLYSFCVIETALTRFNNNVLFLCYLLIGV